MSERGATEREVVGLGRDVLALSRLIDQGRMPDARVLVNAMDANEARRALLFAVRVLARPALLEAWVEKYGGLDS